MKNFFELAWLVVVLVALTATRALAERPIDFSQQIRPLLSDRCFQCHGPDENTREADLRLDTPDGLFRDLGGYSAVAPGDLAASELVVRIDSHDTDLKMPPPESNKSLSESERELIKRWIEQGATWQQHWAFERPRQPAVPIEEILGAGYQHWPRNPIDVFVLRKMLEKHLSPSPDADAFSLVRRLYLDLTGVPPTAKEADRWVARLHSSSGTATSDLIQTEDKNFDIDESQLTALVDRLLASPRYGERWGRRWLDLARYADTNGYEKDRERSIWPFRDWVIQALNSDMPFDRFTIEQLAGDLLPNATAEQKIATGFHRNTMLNEEGGIDPMEFRFYAMTDRVATTGTTWLGLTLECCQCHTHKYDPISHHEYYRLMAFMNNADEPQLELPVDDLDERWQHNRAEAERRLRQLVEDWPLEERDESSGSEESPDESATEDHAAESSNRRLSRPANIFELAEAQVNSDGGSEEQREQKRQEAFEQAFEEWLQDERDNVAVWQALEPVEASSNLPILTIQADHSVFASGDTAKRDDYFLTFAAVDFPITAIELEALPDERLPARGPGSTYYEGTLGDFFLTEFEVQANGERVEIADASESYAKNRFGDNPVSAALATDGDVQTGWSVHGRQGERHVAVFALEKPIPAGMPIQIHMVFGRHFASSLGRFRIRATNGEHQPEARDFSDQINRLLRLPEKQLTAEQRDVLLQCFLLHTPVLQKATEEIRRLRKRPEVPTTLVLRERPDAHTRKTFRHHRGEYLQPREEVEPGTPEVLHSLPEDAPNNRLGLAEWIVSRRNPLTARVVVNRAWAEFFGSGIVPTLGDFGLQGASPSHPELLDWLAVKWMSDDDFSMKKLHRLIVTSRTYRQASAVTTAATNADPDNRLLSYFPRLRLDAEMIRDSLLSSSALLCNQFGGPPVRPPQPSGVTEVAFGSPKWKPSVGEDRYRRSVYTMIKRTAPFAMYSIFDAPTGEKCLAERNRSNSPLQALTLLNDEMVLEFSRAAGRIAAKAGSTELAEKLSDLFRKILTRPPEKEELDLLSDFWQQQFDRYRADPQAARSLLGIEEKTRDEAQADHSAPVGDLEASGDDQDSASDGLKQSQPPERSIATDLAKRAAWTTVARAIYGLDEAQTRP